VKTGYSISRDEAAKALYAISSLIRNNVNGQEAFNSENGSAMLQVMTIFSFKIMGTGMVDM
jgi:hsp70-interacting protein